MSAQPDADVFMLTAAKWWAGRGVPVLPLNHPVEGPDGLICSCRKPNCKSPAKHPMADLVPNGLTDASNDPDVVTKWWQRHPFANIGLRTGVVFDLLDIDGPNGFASFDNLVADLGGQPQAMCVVESGRENGGRHYYMTPPGKSALTGGLRGVPAGIDVKGAGGYVVAAPSRHISGNRYKVSQQYNAPTGSIPWATVYDALTANDPARKPRKPFEQPRQDPFAATPSTGSGFGQAVLDRIVAEMHSAQPGNRWQTFATECAMDIARGVHGGAFDRAEAEQQLSAAARQVGMEDDEIDRLPKLIDDVLAAGITDPIAPKPRDERQQKTWTEQESRTTEWEVPDSLDLRVPAFPLDALGWMAQPTRHLADELQTPVDIVAMMFLATVAATVRGRAAVQITPRWSEPLNIYVAVVAGAGETKSPALGIVSRPLRELEGQLQNAVRPQVAELEQRRRIYKSRLDKAERQAANDPDKMVEAVEAQRLLNGLADSALPRILAADSTPEGLVALMAQQRGTIAVLSAEGGMFDTFAGGRYSGGMANLDAVLQAHDGREPILVDRKGSPPIRVDSPCLTLGLAVQPQVLASVGKSEAAVGRGFLARFLFSVPQTMVGTRRVSQPAEDADFSPFDRAVKGIDGLLSRGSEDFEDGSPKAILRLSSSSSKLFYGYRESLEPRRHGRTGDLAGIRAWANKLDGQIARLAALLQLIYLAEHPQNAQNPTRVEDDALNGALKLADYLIGHAVAAHLLLRGDALTASDSALQLLGWLRKNGLSEFTVRDAHQALRGRTDFQKAEHVREAATALVEHRYLRQLKPDTSTPGRPTEKYAVNPLEPT